MNERWNKKPYTFCHVNILRQLWTGHGKWKKNKAQHRSHEKAYIRYWPLGPVLRVTQAHFLSVVRSPESAPFSFRYFEESWAQKLGKRPRVSVNFKHSGSDTEGDRVKHSWRNTKAKVLSQGKAPACGGFWKLHSKTPFCRQSQTLRRIWKVHTIWETLIIQYVAETNCTNWFFPHSLASVVLIIGQVQSQWPISYNS